MIFRLILVSKTHQMLDDYTIGLYIISSEEMGMPFGNLNLWFKSRNLLYLLVVQLY